MIRVGRRQFLVGAGGALMAIPALEGLVPKAARADAGAPPFLLTYFQPMGICQDLGGGGFPESFWPVSGPGAISAASLAADEAAGRTVGVLKGFASQVSLVRRVHCLRTDGGTSHNSGSAQVLTGSGFVNTLVEGEFNSGNEYHRSKALSEDFTQRVARDIGGNRFIAVTAGPLGDPVGYAINTRENLGQIQGNSMNAEYGPKNLYNRLFPTSSSSAQQLLRQSANDRVRDDLVSLSKSSRLSAEDKKRLEQHTEAVRQIELRLACSSPPETLTGAANNVGDLEDWSRYEERAKLANKLAAIAVNCGATQVMQVFGTSCHYGKHTDMFEQGTPEYDNGAPLTIHDYSHRMDNAFKTTLPRYDRWHMRRFAEILHDLGPEGFNILDNGLALFHTDIATGNHECNNIPFIVAGTAGGRIRTGQYIDANTTNNKVLATLGAALGLRDGGAPISQFGGKTHDSGEVAGGHLEALKGAAFPTS